MNPIIPSIDVTFAGINIAAAEATVYTWTVAEDGAYWVELFVDGLQLPAADYIFTIQKQRGGAGNVRPCYPKTTVSKELNDQNIYVASGQINLEANDVINFRVEGQAGDVAVSGGVVAWRNDSSDFDPEGDIITKVVILPRPHLRKQQLLNP